MAYLAGKPFDLLRAVSGSVRLTAVNLPNGFVERPLLWAGSFTIPVFTLTFLTKKWYVSLFFLDILYHQVTHLRGGVSHPTGGQTLHMMLHHLHDRFFDPFRPFFLT